MHQKCRYRKDCSGQVDASESEFVDNKSLDDVLKKISQMESIMCGKPNKRIYPNCKSIMYSICMYLW